MAQIIASACVYQAGWFVCVLWGDYAALACVALSILFVYYLFNPPKRVWINAVRVTAVGCAMDAILVYMGFYAVASESPTLPLWLACIWALFALALPYGFSFLAGRYVLASVLGALGGPLAYVGGAALSPALSLALPALEAAAILALLWAAMMPYLVWLTRTGQEQSASALSKEQEVLE